MAKQRGIKSIDRSRYREYQRVAEHFYDAAKDSVDLEYWTAAAVLIVHAAIAYADALCIKVAGQRSVGIVMKMLLHFLKNMLRAEMTKRGH